VTDKRRLTPSLTKCAIARAASMRIREIINGDMPYAAEEGD